MFEDRGSGIRWKSFENHIAITRESHGDQVSTWKDSRWDRGRSRRNVVSNR